MNDCLKYISISISLWLTHEFSVDHFSRLDILRLSLRPSKDTFCADHLPRSGIVTTSNFVRRWTSGHLAIHLETGPTVLPFGSGRSNRISMSDLSFIRKRVPSRAATRMIRKYRCLLVQSSSKLRRVYDCVSMRDQCGGKKRLLLRGLSHFEVLAGSRRQ